MSVTALRLIPCRRLSSTRPGLKKVIPWTVFGKIAKLTGAIVLGGCVFITYEVITLNHAVTVDTQAILQEKQKSYIYLTPITKVEQETLGTNLTYKARKELHIAARKLIAISSRVLHRPLDEHLSHLDADPHEWDLWMLLKRTGSTSRQERLQAIHNLAHRPWQ
ncbi:protein SERAC1, partial [Tachysurus ichikawai]